MRITCLQVTTGWGSVLARRCALVEHRASVIRRMGAKVDVGHMMRLEREAGKSVVERKEGDDRPRGAGGDAMPPPQPKQPSERMLAASLGLTGPLSEEQRDRWIVPSAMERAALDSLRDGANSHDCFRHMDLLPDQPHIKER